MGTVVAYTLVLVAVRHAPVGYVTMLRESSVVLGAVVGWLWLDLANAAARPSAAAADSDRTRGIQHAARYFFDFELPKVSAWLEPVATRNSTCLDMQESWYDP